jgi:hypothetical protein
LLFDLNIILRLQKERAEFKARFGGKNLPEYFLPLLKQEIMSRGNNGRLAREEVRNFFTNQGANFKQLKWDNADYFYWNTRLIRFSLIVYYNSDGEVDIKNIQDKVTSTGSGEVVGNPNSLLESFLLFLIRTGDDLTLLLSLFWMTTLVIFFLRLRAEVLERTRRSKALLVDNQEPAGTGGLAPQLEWLWVHARVVMAALILGLFFYAALRFFMWASLGLQDLQDYNIVR